MDAIRRVLALPLAAVGFAFAAAIPAAGAQSFPIARPNAYMVKDIHFVGDTDFKSLEGSYTSGR